MDDSPQSVYAKCLPNSRGYPLWFPEPSTTLPQSYQQDGLQIGDVGIVSPTGRFDVLFNISLSSQHALHRRHRALLAKFKFDPIEIDIDEEVDVRSNADPPRSVITSPGITRVSSQSSPRTDNYEFVPTSATGAILILPDGATCHELLSKELFRKIAMERAFDWYEIARERYGDTINARSLYLITGFYKSRSWSIASYHDPTSVELKNDRRMKVTAEESAKGGRTRRHWECTFPVHCRDGPGSNHNGSVNQTVYISGFKIAVRDDVLGWLTREPVIESVPAIPARSHRCHFARFLKRMFGKKHPPRRAKTIDHVPALVPAYHPSDTINKFLLDQDPDALVAVTHDSQWIAMVDKGEVTSEDLMQEELLGQFLLENYSLVSQSENNAVYLQHKGGCSKTDKDEDESGVRQKSTCDTWQPWHPTPSTHESQVVITRIRAENVATGLGRMPIGFCILVEFNGTERKTKNKQVRVSDSITEWDDVIVLPLQTSSKVQLSVCASFELSPMLGRGQVLHTLERSVDEWNKDIRLTFFSSRKDQNTSCGSLLVTVECRALSPLEIASCGNNTSMDYQLALELVQQTDLGHDRLLCYHHDPTQENINISILHFERARTICPPDHPCRFAVLRNLATAYLLQYQINSTVPHLDSAISLHQEALDWCPSGHPDRPATLVYLAQALVYRYESQGCGESIGSEIKKLVAEARDSCSVDSHEYRAAGLVLQTCARCRVENNIHSSDLDELIWELYLAAQEPPSDDFDQPQRLHNLSVVLLKRYELRGDLSDLDKSIAINEAAVELMPVGHPNHTRVTACLCVSLIMRFEHARDFVHLEKCISISEAALQWVAETNINRASIVISLGVSLLKHFGHVHDPADLEKCISISEAALQWVEPLKVDQARILINLGISLLKRFQLFGDLDDLDESIMRLRKGCQLMPGDDPDLPGMIASLGRAHLWYFARMCVPVDLDTAISMMEEACRLMSESHPNRAGTLVDLGVALLKRFERNGDLHDLEVSINIHKEAAQLAVDGCSGGEVAFSFENAYETFWELIQAKNKTSQRLERFGV